MTAEPPVPPPSGAGPDAKRVDEASATAIDRPLKQCPECGSLLTSDDRGAYCIVDDYPRSRQRPARGPELSAWLEQRLREGGGEAGESLPDLASRLGLRWGTPDLKPGRLFFHRDSSVGPALAVQEAVGSDNYLIVTLGSTPWVTGLHQFFVVSEDQEVSGAKVRVRKEALAKLSEDGNLTCLDAGEVEVAPQVASLPPLPGPLRLIAARDALVSLPPPVTATPGEASPRVTFDWRLKITLFGVVALLLVGGLLMKVSGGGAPTQPQPRAVATAVVPAAPLGAESTLELTGSLEVTTNCSAVGDIDSFYLPESKRQPVRRLRWVNLSPRAHRLKLTCVGFEVYTKTVSIEPGQQLVLPPIELQRSRG